MCDLSSSAMQAGSQGIMQVGQAYMEYSEINHRYKMGQIYSRGKSKLARQNAMLKKEQVTAQNDHAHRERMGNLFEIQKAKVQAIGEVNAEASAQGRAGNSIDSAIFDVYNEASMAEGDTNSDFKNSVRKSILAENGIAQQLHQDLLGSMNTATPGDSTALMLQIANAGLTSYNTYTKLKAAENKSILVAASNTD